MTTDQQTKFDILNNAWSELEPHVKDKVTYRRIMSSLFRMYYRQRQAEFSDEWWKEVVDEFIEFPKPYWETPYFDFAGELAMGFLNFWENKYKLNTEKTFRDDISVAFEKEIIRVDKRQNGVLQTVLPST